MVVPRARFARRCTIIFLLARAVSFGDGRGRDATRRDATRSVGRSRSIDRSIDRRTRVIDRPFDRFDRPFDRSIALSIDSIARSIDSIDRVASRPTDRLSDASIVPR